MARSGVGIRNTLIHLMDGSSFTIGLSLCSYAVIMPAYVKSFTDNAVLLALLPVLVDVGPSIPQLISAYVIRRSPHSPGAAVRTYFLPGFLVRICFLLIGGGILLFSANRVLSLVSFFVLFAVYTVALGYATPKWIQVLSITIPNRVRPEFLSFRDVTGRVLGIALSFAVPFLLSLGSFPNNYGILFLFSGIIFSAGFLPVMFFRPTVALPARTGRAPENFHAFVRSNWRSITGNRALLAFLVIFWSLSVSRISYAYITPFIMDYVLSRMPARESAFWLSTLNTTLLLSMAASSGSIGTIIRRIGHRNAILIGTACLFLANVLVVAWPSLWTAMAAQVLMAYFAVAGYLVPLNTYMDFANPHDRPAVMAFASVINALFIIVFSGLGSGIAAGFGYETALLFSAGLALVLLIVIVCMKKTAD